MDNLEVELNQTSNSTPPLLPFNTITNTFPGAFDIAWPPTVDTPSPLLDSGPIYMDTGHEQPELGQEHNMAMSSTMDPWMGGANVVPQTVRPGSRVAELHELSGYYGAVAGPPLPVELEGFEFRGEISGSMKVLRRKEVEANEVPGLETATVGRVGEVEDYLQTLDSSPAEPMPEGLSNYSEESPALVQNIKVICKPKDIISNGHQIPLWYRDEADPGEEVDGLLPMFGNWRAIFSRKNNPPTYHVKSGLKGLIEIPLSFKGVVMTPGAIFRLRSFFSRRNPAFENEPVNKICEQHYMKMMKSVDKNKHALQALPGHGDEYTYHDDGTRTSLCLDLPPPDQNGDIETTFRGWSPCASTCHSVKINGKAVETSRDIALVHQLEMELENGNCTVLATTSTTIWTKADIVRRDYVKHVRFEAKGGASVKQQDAQRLKVAKGIVKRKKKDKKGILEKNLFKLLNTCKANGISLDKITQIVSEVF